MNPEPHNNLTDKVMSEIEDKKILPKSKRFFLVHRALLWIPVFIIILLVAVSFSGILFHILNSGWDVYRYTQNSFGEFLLDTFPYVFLGLLLVFLFAALRGLRNTHKGYTYKTFKIVVGCIVVSILVGSGLFVLGVGNFVDNNIGRNIPLHSPALMRQTKLWTSPENGRIMGRVVKSEGKLILLDTNNRAWNIDKDDLTDEDELLLNYVSQVRMIGFGEPNQLFFHPCRVLISPYDEELFESLNIMPSTTSNPQELLHQLQIKQSCALLSPYFTSK